MEAPKPRLAALSWLIGTWVEETRERRCDELWSPMVDGNMAGAFRWMAEGRPKMYEFMILEEHEAGLSLHLKHFGPDLVGWEEKDTAETFDVVSADSRHFACTSRTGSPRLSISYRRISETELTVRVEKLGQPSELLLSFEFRRCVAANPSAHEQDKASRSIDEGM